jgi:transposase-like protein
VFLPERRRLARLWLPLQAMSISRPKRKRRAKGGFHPPHCPNRDCSFFQPQPGWSYRKTGLYLRPSDQSRFPSFRCNHCGRYFSSRTFSPTYWLRRRKLFPRIVNLSVNGAALRQIGRILDISHATAGRHLARAARHCLLLHAQLCRTHTIDEPLVIDGFETFVYSQFFPCHFNLAVGARSWFLYHFTVSPLRRKGSMTPSQIRKRQTLEQTLGRPDPKAVEKGILDLLRPLKPRLPLRPAPIPPLPSSPPSPSGPARPPNGDEPPDAPDPIRQLMLYSDHHRAYPRALQSLQQEDPTLRIIHQTISSKERRTTSNPLFPVNLADLLIRHSKANHRRETIAFSKKLPRAVQRMAVFLVWRNLIKRQREKRPGVTAAMAAGVVSEPWSWSRVFRRRRFVRPQDLSDRWWDYYWGKVEAPAMGKRAQEPIPAFAF